MFLIILTYPQNRQKANLDSWLLALDSFVPLCNGCLPVQLSGST